MKEIPLEFGEQSENEMKDRAERFASFATQRRTVRQFSDRPIPAGVLEACLRTAGSAPSGANLQPWHFVVVTDPETKRRIREGAEQEEEAFYDRRAPQEWLDAVEPFNTLPEKPFLEQAPCLIAIFAQRTGADKDGRRPKHYYVNESVGIATGLLITAVHHAGLVSLTHTPSPMRFLNEILDRPDHERPFLLLVVGYPADDATVPDIQRKPVNEISTFI